MMTNDYLSHSKLIDYFCFVLSVGYKHHFPTTVVESRICKSPFFKLVLNGSETSLYETNDLSLIKQIFPEIPAETQYFSYIETEWCAEMYIYLLDQTGLSLETIFAFLPLQKAYEMFFLYHELDLSQSKKYFDEMRINTSLISLRMKQLKLKNNEVAEATGLSASTINSLRNKKLNASKLNLNSAVLLSRILRIDVETLLEN